MNTNNYSSLEQSKTMKELGYPQDKTDCVWIRNYEKWILLPRDGEATVLIKQGSSPWFAAPNAQEIELDWDKPDSLSIYNASNSGWLTLRKTQPSKTFGRIHHAQARADAWIWERENGK
jgi:hypothetical protein